MKQRDDDARPDAGAPKPSGSGKLTDRMKDYVVERLAGFDSPSAIARSLGEEFGVRIARQSIEMYDPTRNPRCPERWKQQFLATRRAIIEGKAERGAANRMVRLRWREKMVLRAMEKEDFALADRILNSIANEAGDIPANAPESVSEERRARAFAAVIAQLEAAQAEAAANGWPAARQGGSEGGAP